MNVLRMIKVIIEKYQSIRNPVKYAKRLGVNFTGKNVTIYGKVNWGSEPWLITIGDNVYITNNCTFITHDGGTLLFRNTIPDLEITKPISVGNNVYIGLNVIILPGVNIGDHSIIGAGSLITKSFPPGSVIAGNPARVIKTTEQYLEKIKSESLHFGHLTAEDKASAIKEYYDKFNGRTK